MKISRGALELIKAGYIGERDFSRIARAIANGEMENSPELQELLDEISRMIKAAEEKEAR